MEISRRDFVKYLGASALALGLSAADLATAERILADSSSPPVLWLSGSSCTGCSVSLLNAVNPTVDQVLLNTISLKFHPALMSAAGDMAVTAARSTANAGGYILAVEGAIPTGSNGRYCYVWDEGGVPVTMASAVRSLAAKAAKVVAVGTCAAYGGIPSAYSQSASMGVGKFLGRSVVNLPGCPTHPDWLVGGLVALLAGKPIALDSYGRPTVFYTAQKMHERCPLKETEEAKRFGQAGRCVKELGCKGETAHCDCDRRLWNNRQNWCVGANGLCIGCTEPSFPAFPLHKGGEHADETDD